MHLKQHCKSVYLSKNSSLYSEKLTHIKLKIFQEENLFVFLFTQFVQVS